MGGKNDEFCFLTKLMCLGHVGFMVANAVVFDGVFFPSKVQMLQSRTADLNLI